MQSEPIKTRFELLNRHLDERSRRLWLAAEAISYGRGGISNVSKITGVTRNTISDGCKEVTQPPSPNNLLGPTKRIRNTGGGRKPLIEKDNKILADLTALIDPYTRGDPDSPLLWTTKSLRNLASAMKNKGHNVSFRTIGSLLKNLGYSLQSNRKTHEGESHVDRNSQFEHIYSQCKLFIDENQPVISIDAKKKELVGNFKNNGKEWRPVSEPELVNVYDFPSTCDKAIPYGVYDVANNMGWVSVGMDHDTASFAVESIRRWWKIMGSGLYPKAKKILITADCGGSNGYRTRLWKKELQQFANEESLSIKVCHLPPGTSKWNKVEHRLFSYISINWRGKPLTSFEVIVNLIASTKTVTGLMVKSALDKRLYPKGIKITDKEMETINLTRDSFHGEWNYSIHPHID